LLVLLDSPTAAAVVLPVVVVTRWDQRSRADKNDDVFLGEAGGGDDVLPLEIGVDTTVFLVVVVLSVVFSCGLTALHMDTQVSLAAWSSSSPCSSSPGGDGGTTSILIRDFLGDLGDLTTMAQVKKDEESCCTPNYRCWLYPIDSLQYKTNHNKQLRR
jgi:hypothetical protein